MTIRDVLPRGASIWAIVAGCPIFLYQLAIAAWTYNDPFPVQRDWTDDI